MFSKFPLDKLRLGLGTAQFGMQYGLSGKDSPSLENIINIIKIARDSNVELIDTAPAYNQSEKLLGLTKMTSNFKIVTKLVKANHKLASKRNIQMNK